MTTLADKQRQVKVGVAIGIAGYVTILTGSYFLVPAPEAASLEARLTLAAQCVAVSTLMLLLGIGAVANGRFASDAIDPLARAEAGRQLVHARYLQNTLEQLVMHVIAIFGLAIDGRPLALRLLPGLAACFVIGRTAFWLGYLKDPMKRGPGFTMTLQPTMLALLYLTARALGRATSLWLP